MFLGHIAVGFAAKRAAPKTSLGVLLGASELIDLLFPVFVLTGWERVRIEPGSNPFLAADFYYPLSHSLAMTCVWALAAALGVLARRAISNRGGDRRAGRAEPLAA